MKRSPTAATFQPDEWGGVSLAEAKAVHRRAFSKSKPAALTRFLTPADRAAEMDARWPRPAWLNGVAHWQGEYVTPAAFRGQP